LIGAPGLVLLLPAGLIAALLVVDEELSRRAGRERSQVLLRRTSSARPTPSAQGRER
jgi:hypothetical protein